MADGIPSEEPDIPRDSSRKDKQGNKLPAFRGEGVHSVYETQMINMAARKRLLFDEIRKNLGADHGMPLASDGRSAALATLKTMRDVANILAPRSLVDVYEESFAPDSASHVQALWDAFGDATGKVMALGVRTLAMIWDAAWEAGGGDTNHGRIEPGILRGHYENPNFLRSVTVNEIEDEIAHPSPLAGGGEGRRPPADTGNGDVEEESARQAAARVSSRKRVKRSAPKKLAKSAAKRRH